MKPQATILKGFLLINLPIILVWAGLPIVGYLTTKGKALPFNYLVISILLAFLFTWLWWSFCSVKWEIKTYSKAQHPLELKDRAMRASLVFSNNHFLQQHRWTLPVHKKDLKEVLSKIDVRDKVSTIEMPIVIYYELLDSLWFLIIELSNFLFTFLVGLFFATNYASGQLFSNIGLGIIGFSVLSLFISIPFMGKIDLIPAFTNLIKSLNKEGVLEIDEQQIRFLKDNQPPIFWKDIQKVELILNHVVFSIKEEENLIEKKVEIRGIDKYLLQRILNKQLKQGDVWEYFRN